MARRRAASSFNASQLPHLLDVVLFLVVVHENISAAKVMSFFSFHYNHFLSPTPIGLYMDHYEKYNRPIKRQIVQLQLPLPLCCLTISISLLTLGVLC